MSKFALVSTKLLVNKSVIWVVLAALIAYVLPWIVNRSAGLSFNGYDLAEWASVNPSTHNTTPQLLPSLLLRMQLTLLTLIIAAQAGKPFKSLLWWLCAGLAAALTVAQLPPFEFFTIARSDGNYGQQFTLCLITLIGSIIGLSGIVYRWRVPIGIGLGLVGIITSIAGYAQALQLMLGFNLGSTIGLGVIVLVVCYGLLLGAMWWGKRDKP